MKRNEKIEVRVSLEEKERLSELAVQEAESISGLIEGKRKWQESPKEGHSFYGYQKDSTVKYLGV